MFTIFTASAFRRSVLKSSAHALAFLAFNLVVIFGFASSARADIVSVTFSGSGGNASLGPTAGTLTEPSLNFTSIAPIDVSITIDATSTPGAYDVSETTTFAGISGVQNNTGVTWSGFTWQLISSPSGSFSYSPSAPPFSGLDFKLPTAAFPPASGSTTLATFSGSTLATGDYFAPGFYITFPSAGTYVIRETPVAVPEPSSLVLLALGAAGIFCVRRRRIA